MQLQLFRPTASHAISHHPRLCRISFRCVSWPSECIFTTSPLMPCMKFCVVAGGQLNQSAEGLARLCRFRFDASICNRRCTEFVWRWYFSEFDCSGDNTSFCLQSVCVELHPTFVATFIRASTAVDGLGSTRKGDSIDCFSFQDSSISDEADTGCRINCRRGRCH